MQEKLWLCGAQLLSVLKGEPSANSPSAQGVTAVWGWGQGREWA
jgi:hypothetical protein